MRTSVLVITRNRPYVIGDCLRAVLPQLDPARHELIVVDSSERDETAKVVQAFGSLKYHRVSLPLGTRPQAYTIGARLATGDVVALLDDDSIVFPDWLKAIEDCYLDPNVGAAGGRVVGRDWSEGNAPAGDPHDLEVVSVVEPSGRIRSRLFLDPGGRVDVDTLRGCNMSVRRGVLEELGYFDARFRGQNCRVEDDVCLGVRRRGYRIVFEPKAFVRHLAEERPDIPRSEKNARSEFYVWRNTVWLLVKHFGWSPSLVVRAAVASPVTDGLRRVLGGSLRRPRLGVGSLEWLPSLVAAVTGGVWGVVMSAGYCIRDGMMGRSASRLPALRFVDGRMSTTARPRSSVS